MLPTGLRLPLVGNTAVFLLMGGTTLAFKVGIAMCLAYDEFLTFEAAHELASLESSFRISIYYFR